MSTHYYSDSNYRLDNVFKPISAPTADYVKFLHPNQNVMEPMVKLNVRIIPPIVDRDSPIQTNSNIQPVVIDMSRAYAARDLAGLNTSDQKIPDAMVLDKNPITKVPQRPFFIQT